VNKNISAVFFGDEPKTLGFIEPLNGSFYHTAAPP
jgi:hypothetical protein